MITPPRAAAGPIYNDMQKKLCLVLLPVLLAACSETRNEQTTAPAATTYTLVFMDKTRSISPDDPFVKTRYASAFKSLTDENIRMEGDMLEVYYIHENTSKARALSVRSRTAKEPADGLSPTDREAAENAYTLSIQKERQLICQALMQKFMESNPSSSNAETNIGGAVPVMAAALAEHREVKVWFFSDMIESMRSGRDFHRQPPHSHEQARAWALEDAARYTGQSLAGARVSMVLPFPPNSSSKVNNPNVTAYWKAFFEELGAGKVTEE